MSQETSVVKSIAERYFEVLEPVEAGQGVYRLQIVGVKEGSPRQAFRSLYRDLIRAGYAPAIRSDGPRLYLFVTRYPQGQKLTTWAVLAALTVLSVYVSGYYLMTAGGWGPLTPLLYTIGLLGPLLIHEVGHWIAMWRYNVPRSLPYLIPAPPLQFGFLGTLGAVINMRWVPATSDELALIGVAGPLAGFIAALPVAVIGIETSVIKPASAVPPGSALTVVPVIMVLLLTLLRIPPWASVYMSPLAYAAYIVFFVTFLNLMPVGQLDGGHVIRAAIGMRGHTIVSIAFIIILLALGSYNLTLGLFGIIALAIFLLTRGRHPGPAIEDGGLTKTGLIAVILYGVLLALTIPIPA